MDIDEGFRTAIHFWNRTERIYWCPPCKLGPLDWLLNEEIGLLHDNEIETYASVILISLGRIWHYRKGDPQPDLGAITFLSPECRPLLDRAIYRVALKLLKKGASLYDWPDCALADHIRRTYLVVLVLCCPSQTKLPLDIVRELKGYLIK